MALLDEILCNVKQAEPLALPSVEPSKSLPLSPVTHRAFGDNKTMRESIFNNVMETLSTAYPIENTRYRLELKNVGLDDNNHFSLADQKKAILQGESLERKITGEWHLFDKATNKLVDSKATTIARVPYATDRGTFIYRGNEYTVANQMRLRPGVFTRVKENGVLEAHVNVKSGTGPSFRVYMEPQTGIFRLRVGQSTLKMYPILRAMGVQDRDIRSHWGDALLQQNIAADDPGAVTRAFTSLVNRRDLQEDAQSEQKANSETLQIAKEDQLKAAELQKEAKIGAKESDRKWQKLWYRGRLRAEMGNDGKPWVYLDVHRGLVDAALASLKDEGVECERTPNAAHISVIRSSEAQGLYDKHGPTRWKGVAKDGTPVRFALNRTVSLAPEGWKDIDRVWFLEVDSPELQKYRKDLGLSPLPVSEKTGHEFRFHITFAVHRLSTTIKRAEYLFGCKRAAAAVGEGFTLGSASNDHGKGLLDVFNKMELDEDTTKLTLGNSYKNAGPEALLRTSQKLLNIFNKKEEVDDRDSLSFQTLHSPEDFFAERIKKDAGQLGRKLLWRSTLRGNVKHIPTGALTPQIYSVLLKSGMGMPVEEVNPFELYDQNLRVLRLGEGGIPSLDSVPDESRNVQPSQFGFIDPIRAPESEKVGVDSRVSEGVLRGSDGQFYTSMRNFKTGKPELISAIQAAASTVAFPGEMSKTDPKVRAMVHSRQVQYVDRDKVDFELPSTSQMFTASSNMTPMISGIKGGRLLMGAKYVIQALPLQNPEAPLVQNLVNDETNESFDEKFGARVGALRARDRGVVTDIGKDHVQVRYVDGTKENHELYQNFPFNRKTFLHNTPVVNVGDQIKPNQVLAKSNYTDDKGVVAMGNNLRVAYMPYKGLNYEDAIVISESAAKKMSSEHMYQHEVEADPNIVTGRSQYVSIFPSKFNKQQLSVIDKTGAAKIGTVVKSGDPLILSLNKAKSTAVHRGHKAMFSDGAVLWDHESDGIVTDVDKTKNGGYNVTVKAYMPAREGDKLAGRYGDKGVISKIISDDQMIHDKDGNPYHILLNPLGVISRGNPSQIHEALLGKIARKRGNAYKIPGFTEGSLVDFVKKELQDSGIKDTEDVFDPTTGKKIKDILTGERFIYKLHHTAESKGRGRDVGAYTSEGLPARGGEFGCFWGHQKVRTMHGDVSIARLVEKRQSALVWTYDESLQEWVYRPITDWFVYRASVNDLITVELLGTAASIGGKVSHRTCIYPTRNHVVFRGDGTKCLAGDLKPGDTMLTNGPLPTRDQMSLMLGSLLGDAHARPETFVDEHSCKQAAYVSWKQSVLAGLLAKTSDCIRKESMSSVVVKHRGGQRDWIRSRKVIVGYRHICAYLHRLCYTDGVKTINEEWLNQITPLGVAAWFLDDGSLTNSAKKRGQIRLSGYISTHAFTLEEVERLSHWLSKHLNASCIRRVSNNVLGLGVEACQSMIRLVAENVPFTAIPKSKMYLRASVEALQTLSPPRKPETICRLGRVPALVKSVKPYKHDKSDVKEINVYDITVDGTHTYTVGGVLVSNSKRISNMEINALLSHGATEVLKDAQVVRGQRNDDYWRAFRLGLTPPSPKVPFVYDKFLTHLKGAGINIKKDGERLQLFAMTDKDVTKLSSGPLTSDKTVKGDALEEVSGGLFDRGLTGGHGGSRWAHIPLSEPVPNPVMEEPIRRLLGLTQDKYEQWIAGKVAYKGHYGGKAIQKALSDINLDDAINSGEQSIREGSQAKRDKAVKVLGYLKNMKKNNLRPEDWVMTKVPVIPPSFRPIGKYRDVPLVADANLLYQDLIRSNNVLKEIRDVVDVDSSSDERLQVYNSFKAVSGLGDPIQAKHQDKQVKGLLKHVFGSSPKCYDDATEILTRDGWVDFPEYDGKTAVATLNPETDAFEWQMPQAVIHESYIGKMVHTKTRQIDLLVTPNHEHWLRQRVGRGKNDGWGPFKKVSADSLVGVCRRVNYKTSATKWEGEPGYELSFLGVSVDMSVFAEFLGLWVADGWNHEDGGTTYLAFTEHSQKNALTGSLLDRLGLPYNRKEYTKTYKGQPYVSVYWSVNSKELVDWLTEHAGMGAGSKHLSPFVLSWPKHLLERVLAGYLAGDGEKREANSHPEDNLTFSSRSSLTNTSGRFSTTSSALVDNLQELSLKIGLRIKCTRAVTHDNPDWNDQYHCSVSGWDKAVVEYPEQTQYVDYHGGVHCVTVPNGLLFVRRAGIPSVSGNSGMFQRRVLGAPVDVVGRATITPNPDLNMDQVGLPETKAWTIYRPFIMRRLVREGMPALAAAQAVANQIPVARKALVAETQARPVLINRAPTMHRYGFMAAWPVLTKGETLQISPVLTAGFNADFDGDAMNYHVPVTDGAVNDAINKMLPSKNLRSAANFKVHYLPRQEFLMGLHIASTAQKDTPPRVFASKEDVIRAYNKGDISLGDRVIVK